MAEVWGDRQAEGSSPRVRGKPRISLSPSSSPGSSRVCGENSQSGTVMPFSVGSSPRVRGKPRSSGIVSHASRLIPACAGKTHLPGLSRSASTAHPRACGENENVAGHDDAFQGSSPRVRGKQRVSCCVPSSCGLIPARAGKTPHGVGVGVERRAHPRACGENAPAGRPSRGTSGSSPRVRGKPG